MTLISLLFAIGTSKWAIPVPIIAAGISALSGLVGQGISAAQNRKAAKNRDKYIEDAKQKEQNWYDRNYYADNTQRADAQRAINMVSQQLKDRARATAGRAAMGGATDEAVAQQKAVNNQALADVVGAVAAEGSKRKDAIDQQHHTAVQSLDATALQMQDNEAARRAKNLQAAMQTAGNLAASIVQSDTTGANTTKGNGNTEGNGATDSSTQLDTTYKDIELDNSLIS